MARSTASMAVVFIAGFLLVSGVVHEASAAITCGKVASAIGPCISYIRSVGGVVPPRCCSGVRSLSSQAKTTADRQAVCSCLKQFQSSTSGINPKVAAGLPAKCGVSVQVAINPSTDCSKVH